MQLTNKFLQTGIQDAVIFPDLLPPAHLEPILAPCSLTYNTAID